MALAERGKSDTRNLIANTAAYTISVEAWNAIPLVIERGKPSIKASSGSRSRTQRKK